MTVLRRAILLQAAILLVAYLATAGATTRAAGAAPGLAQLAGKAGCFHQENPDEEDPTQGCASGRALLGADAVAVTPDGRNVYVASRGEGNLLSRGSNGIAEFARDGETGALRQIGCITNDDSDGREGTDGRCADGNALGQANWVTVSPDGRNVYATGHEGGVSIFRREDSGRLTQIGCWLDAAQRAPAATATHCSAPRRQWSAPTAATSTRPRGPTTRWPSSLGTRTRDSSRRPAAR